MTRARSGALGASMALLIIIGLVDSWTGPQLAFGVVYFVPVALAAWRLGRTAGLAIALVATVVWHVLDSFYGVPYFSPWYGLWNAATRASSFVLIALLVAAVRAAEERQAAINQQLIKNLDDLHQSTERIKELKGKLQLVCSWTNRIKSEGRWMRFEEFMQRNFNMAFSHGISEEALGQMKWEIDRSSTEDTKLSALR